MERGGLGEEARDGREGCCEGRSACIVDISKCELLEYGLPEYKLIQLHPFAHNPNVVWLLSRKRYEST